MKKRGLRLGVLVCAPILLLGAGGLLATGVASGAHPSRTALPVLRLPGFLVDYGRELDPAMGFDFLQTHAGLVRLLPDGKPVPDLATWLVSKDHLVYTFKIRKNARFSNGHYVTARDVDFSLSRALAPANSSSGAISYFQLVRGAVAFNEGKSKSILGLKVLGRRALSITITKPVAYFLDVLTVTFAHVLDPAVVSGKPIHDFLTNTCVANQGAGPFTFVCWNRGSTVSSFWAPGQTPTYALVPNPYFYGRKPHIAIKLPAYADNYKEYLAGKLDATDIPTPYLGRWKRKSGQFRQIPTSGIRFLVPDTHLRPFNNVHCRLAMAYAVNRDLIANNVSQGTKRPAYTIVPRGMLGWYLGRDNPHYKPSQARAELAKCPGRATPFELKYRSEPPDFPNMYRAVGQMLSAIGMNVKLTAMSAEDRRKVVTQPLDKSQTQLVEFGWSQDYPDPQDFCSLLLHSGVDGNLGRWSNRQYDRLVDKADTTLNRKIRANLYIRAQHLALSQGALISLTQDLTFNLVKPNVHGLVPSEAYGDLEPKNEDWANVSVTKR